MRREWKTFIASFMVVILLSLSLSVVQANDSYDSIQVELNKVNIAINGVRVGSAGMDYTLTNGNKVPFSILYNGTTYLPMRKVAELVGMNVSWDAKTNTASINTSAASISETVTSPISSSKTEQSLSNNINVISAVLNSINIEIDGSIVGQAGMNYTLANGAQVPYSILYMGTTYLPMRKVAELVGKEVVWDSATNTAGINDLKVPEEPKVEQKPLHIEEIKPTIGPGQALLKINFKLPSGSVIMNGYENFTIVCDTVSSNGTSIKKTKNLFMLQGSDSYTAYMLVDAPGGSANCKMHYQANNTSGYISGLLTEQGTQVLPSVLSQETDLRKAIQVNEGSMAEVTLDAIKGILFSTKMHWSASTPDTSKTEQIRVEFIEKSNDGNEENSTVLYYNFAANENEKELIYTFKQDKEYSLSFYNSETDFYYEYGNIDINDEARRTGQLSCQPIIINEGLDKREQLLQEKIKDIIARIIKPGMSDIDKEYAIFKYIQNNTIYGFTSNSNNAYGNLIEGISICDGYAKGTKRLLDAVGIENHIAYGQKGNGMEQGPHAWNIVKIGGEYFHLDALHNCFNLNDTDAKSQYYIWQEGSIPVCNSSFSIAQGLSFFTYDGYVYYTSGDNRCFYFDINRCRPDGSENTKLFTTKNGGSFIFQQNGWIYYFEYEGSKVFKVRTDGSEETLIYSFDDDVRIHDGDISDNALYFFAQTGVRGAYEKSIIRMDIESLDVTTIATFNESANMWKLGDYFYYYKVENGQLVFYRMTLDGSVETQIYKN